MEDDDDEPAVYKPGKFKPPPMIKEEASQESDSHEKSPPHKLERLDSFERGIDNKIEEKQPGGKTPNNGKTPTPIQSPETPMGMMQQNVDLTNYFNKDEIRAELKSIVKSQKANQKKINTELLAIQKSIEALRKADDRTDKIIVDFKAEQRVEMKKQHENIELVLRNNAREKSDL